MIQVSDAECALFRHNGFLKFENVFDDETLLAARAELSEAMDSVAESTGSPRAKLYGIYQRSRAARALAEDPRLLGILRGLLGPNIRLVLNRHNHVSINDRQSAEPRLHRDILHWSRGLVTVIVYLDDSRVDNGCTNVVPGSHLLPFVGVTQVDPPGGGTWMDEHPVYGAAHRQAIPIEVSAGGVLIFDGTLFHSVGANTSPDTRMSLALGFVADDELDARTVVGESLMVAGESLYRGNPVPE